MYSKLESVLNDNISKKYIKYMYENITRYKDRWYNITQLIKKSPSQIDDVIAKHMYIVDKYQTTIDDNAIYRLINNNIYEYKNKYYEIENIVHMLLHHSIPDPFINSEIESRTIKLFNNCSVVISYTKYKNLNETTLERKLSNIDPLMSSRVLISIIYLDIELDIPKFTSYFERSLYQYKHFGLFTEPLDIKEINDVFSYIDELTMDPSCSCHNCKIK